jgi:hypothetical protein
MQGANQLAELRAMMAEHGRTLGRIEGAVEAMQASLDDRKEAQGKLDARLRKVENRQHWYAGLVALGTFLLTKLGLPRIT